MERFKQLENSTFIGPQPSEQDLQEAAERGMKTVIDLRLPGETSDDNAALAAKHGLDYANIPVSKADLSPEQIDALDRVMREKQGPFLIHCATGARAAMLLTLSKAKQKGWSAEKVFDEARSAGFDIQGSPEFAAFVKAMTA